MQPLRAFRETSASRLPTPVVAGRGGGRASFFGSLFSRFKTQPAKHDEVVDNANALLAFPSEAGGALEATPADDVAKPVAVRERRNATISWPIAATAAALVVASIGALAVWRLPLSRWISPAPQTGRLTIETRPGNAAVLIDGEARGSTPLTLTVTPGAHSITLRTANDERVVPLSIAAGADVSQYFEMKPAAPAAELGRLSVTTNPPGARVSVDGRPRGISPVVIDSLTAEEHTVAVTSGTETAERTVLVTAGGMASALFSLSRPAGPVGGWLTIASPFDVDVIENDDVIGTSGTSRIMLAAGRHNVIIANRALGYRETRTVDVAAGRTAAVNIEAPKVAVSINARPWADVSVDGSSAGQTPIANLQVGIGTHELLFRHPQLGERRQTVVVTAKGPNRMTMDFNK